jgi:hypothetical protein
MACAGRHHAAPMGLKMVFLGFVHYKHVAPTEVRQGKLGCSEGESPSRLMEELVFRTKEMNGKV